MTELTHLNEKGEARMVDVSGKDVTHRTARAEGFVAMSAETLDLIESGTAKKGDVLATARIAGIMAAKRTHELIPLCHPLLISKVAVDLAPSRAPTGVSVTAEARVTGQTGVEMEALTGVSAALLTVWDMVKSAEKDENGQYPVTRIEGIRVIKKTKGTA